MNAPMTSYGLARVLSKRGLCSRSQAQVLILAGRVRVRGRVVRDPEARTTLNADIRIDGESAAAEPRIYLMLNKPRGLVVSAKDERGRATIFDCFEVLPAKHLAPVGRLDQASEGLLLLSNDSTWAARLMAPESKVSKHYHVQINRILTEPELARLRAGVLDLGEQLRAESVEVLRVGQKHSWLQVVLNEGKNRQIRRMLASLQIEVLRLIRVQLGALELGTLAKGQWRELSALELETMGVDHGPPE